MTPGNVYFQIVYDLRNQGELLRRSDGAADTYGIIRGGLLPGMYIFKGFRQIE